MYKAKERTSDEFELDQFYVVSSKHHRDHSGSLVDTMKLKTNV
jgi:hypothetical protein